MKILEKYIVRENLKPFITSLIILSSLFIIDLLISKMSLMIEKKLPLIMVAKIFLYSLPAMVALTIPMSILFSSIMSFGRFSVDNELVAIRSCGVNIYKLLKPMFFLITILFVAMLYFNHVILPQSNYLFRNLLIQAVQRNPITSIQPGLFNKNNNYSKLVIYARNRNDQRLEDIIIYNNGERDVSQTISAKSGIIDLSDKGNALIANLFDGEIHERDNKNIENYRIIKFKQFNFDLVSSTQRQDIHHEISDREMTTKMMKNKITLNEETIKKTKEETINFQDQLALINEKENSQTSKKVKKLEQIIKDNQFNIKTLEKTNSSYLVEIYKKDAIAFAIIVFMMLGIPVGLSTKTSGIGVAFAFSAIIFIIYHSTLIAGEQLADRGYLSPIIAMWFPNFILLILSFFMIGTSAKEVNAYDIYKQKITYFFRRKK